MSVHPSQLAKLQARWEKRIAEQRASIDRLLRVREDLIILVEQMLDTVDGWPRADWDQIWRAKLEEVLNGSTDHGDETGAEKEAGQGRGEVSGDAQPG